MFFVNFIDSFECDLSTFFGGWECAMLMWDMILSKCLHLNMNSCCLFNAIINTHLHLHFFAWLYIFRVWIDQRKIMQNNFFSVQYSTNDKWKFSCHWKWFSHIIFRLHFFPQRKKQKFQEDKKKMSFEYVIDLPVLRRHKIRSIIR